jgi:hypothetical protein
MKGNTGWAEANTLCQSKLSNEETKMEVEDG